MSLHFISTAAALFHCCCVVSLLEALIEEHQVEGFTLFGCLFYNPFLLSWVSMWRFHYPSPLWETQLIRTSTTYFRSTSKEYSRGYQGSKSSAKLEKINKVAHLQSFQSLINAEHEGPSLEMPLNRSVMVLSSMGVHCAICPKPCFPGS